jgi:transposase InsO family protein
VEKSTTIETYILIHETILSKRNILSIVYLCRFAGVSRSGYYNWLKTKDNRQSAEMRDKADFELINAAFNHRGYDKGSRSIHMHLLQTGILMNRKKIQRLMRKYKLICPIRKANPYRRMAKAMKENSIAPNIVKRQFREHGAGKILLTDITYLKKLNGQFSYLSTVKDAYTKQILAYRVSDSLNMDFVLETMADLKLKHGKNLDPECVIHSDQGTHYTSIEFRSLFKKDKENPDEKVWIQSMSRRGNCWDNAPQESFFGHMKDEVNLKKCLKLDDVQLLIDDYMEYYNNERYQWGLEKLSPNQYAEYQRTGNHPLKKAA